MVLLQVTDLPLDAWPAIARCLLGADLLALAATSRWAWRHFSQDAFWSHRLSLQEDRDAAADEDEAVNGAALVTRAPPALRRYLRAFSFRLLGCQKGSKAHPAAPRGSAVDLPQFYPEIAQQHAAFSFDVWFCVLPATSRLFAGGILFGAQSSNFANVHYWADYHQQFALVSSDRRLYCSVLNAKPELAADLDVDRWYHLALTYDHATQRVYLDGKLVSELNGAWHSEMWSLGYAQVGSGCVTANDHNLPVPKFCGWYPFNGLVDDFRLWKRALTSEDVQSLAMGGVGDAGEPLFALKRDLLYFPMKNAERMGCSRPLERIVAPLSAHGFPSGVNPPKPSRASRGDRAQWQQHRRRQQQQRQ